ncbi:MAG: UvrD-helicase domain-containing protein [Candidatus Andersenbacteria bacterium]|nr:UvrD-helicase domain-containing protein [Candidatus Andersenbacteria bacterium]MBI3250737.1 UvrD-helicase domain-containing protein [Candidatus Andersenbacteria bacterium]
MTLLLDGLNPEQQKAVTTTHGPVLILAGAGSGKTRALTHRIAYLVHQGIARPQEILAVTFTNKAAGEMRSRLKKLLGSPLNVPRAVSTFHSLGARMLRETTSFHPRSATFTVLDTKDSEKLIRQALKEANISLKTWSPLAVRHIISRAKNSGYTPASFAERTGSEGSEVAALIWPRYETLLARNDAYDFDDLLVVPVRMLQEHSQLAATYQQRWRWLHVDEYQDTNDLQEELLRLLLGPEKHICVVGDDYQAIYSWRGARVDHILGFEKRFPTCQVIHLTQNYRSTPQILETADQVIAGNTKQKHKRLWTENAAGGAVSILALPTDRDEAAWVRQQIAEHTQNGGKLRDCAILYRTNAQSRILEEEFLRARIPYTIVGGFRFYERREIKDALAHLQWLVTPEARLPLDRLSESLLPRVGPKTIGRWEEGSLESGQSLRSYLKTATGNLHVIKLLRAYTNVPKEGSVADILRHLLLRSGYLDYVKLLPDSEERLQNIEELLNVTSVYQNVSEFLQEAALMTDLDTQKAGESDRLTCMTLHAAKGLEFKRVFIVGCEEELIPHINSIDDTEKLEEERRLLYVGITRAREQLTMTYVALRYQAGQLTPRMPSRFLDPITSAIRHDDQTLPQDQFPGDPNLVYANQGEILQHPLFGRGVVISVSGSNLTCVFEGHGVKTISGADITQ